MTIRTAITIAIDASCIVTELLRAQLAQPAIDTHDSPKSRRNNP